MKKALLLLTAAGIFSALQAQITITQSNVPSANMVYIDKIDTMPVTVNIGSSGSSQTWNLTALQSETSDTTIFNTPSASPCATSFPNANLVITMSDGIGHLYSSSSGLSIQGFCMDTGNGSMAIIFNPAQTFITFPSTYLTQFNGTSVMEFRFPMSQPGIDSAKQRSSISYVSLMDGWGTVTTPSYNNANCLRQKYTEYQADSFFVKGTSTGGSWIFYTLAPNNPSYDTTVTYRWLNNSTDLILSEIKLNGNESTVEKASYLFDSFIGIPENGLEDNGAFSSPNPASGEVRIFTDNDNAKRIVITDILGKKSEQLSVESKNVIVNTSSYNNGIYFYRLVDKDGGVISRGKFAVEK